MPQTTSNILQNAHRCDVDMVVFADMEIARIPLLAFSAFVDTLQKKPWQISEPVYLAIDQGPVLPTCAAASIFSAQHASFLDMYFEDHVLPVPSAVIYRFMDTRGPNAIVQLHQADGSLHALSLVPGLPGLNVPQIWMLEKLLSRPPAKQGLQHHPRSRGANAKPAR